MKKRNDERIQKLKQETLALDAVQRMFSANSFFFYGGEFPASIQNCIDSGVKIQGMESYNGAKAWFNSSFMPVWHKVRADLPIDIARKLKNLQRRYLEVMKPVFEGIFLDSIKDHTSFAGWKEISEAQEFYTQLKNTLEV